MSFADCSAEQDRLAAEQKRREQQNAADAEKAEERRKEQEKKAEWKRIRGMSVTLLTINRR